MPALFAYLVSLALLLGGGYAGLQFLTEHQAPALTQAQQTKLAARKKYEREAATRLAASEAAETAAVGPVVVSPDSGSPEPTPAQAAPSTVAVVAAPKPSEIKPEEPAVAASPIETSSVEPTIAASTPPAAPAPAAQNPSDAMAALTQQETEQPRVSEDKPKAAAKKSVRKSRKANDREKLVPMTLQTLRYADGSIGHRLVPLEPRRERTRVSRSEWFGGGFDYED